MLYIKLSFSFYYSVALLCSAKNALNRTKISVLPQSEKSKQVYIKKASYVAGFSTIVFSAGFEPTSSEPESDILSVELREQDCYVVKSCFTMLEMVLPSALPANLAFAKPIT